LNEQPSPELTVSNAGTTVALVATTATLTGWSATTYANSGACRRAARAALGVHTVRGTDFEMRVNGEGRWEWSALELPAASTERASGTLTSEEWLRELVYRLHAEVFPVATGDQPLPTFRIARGFPGGGSARTRIGECWSSVSSADGVTEMFVSPLLDDPMRVAGATAHEMVHMLVGVQHGHKAPFARVAKAIGLEGKMTATTEGEAFTAAVDPILADMPAYPAAAMSLAGRKVKKTYLLKVTCEAEGCEDVVFRMTQKVVTACENGPAGAVLCPCCGGPATIE